MPISYVIDQGHNLVRTTATGTIVIADILKHLANEQRDRTIPWREFVDVRGVTPPYFTSSQVWQAAQAVLAVAVEERPGPRAILVGNETNYGLTRMFATLVEDTFPIRVFREQAQAEHWLFEEYQVDSSHSPGADSGS